jgi:hypothetical protein
MTNSGFHEVQRRISRTRQMMMMIPTMKMNPMTKMIPTMTRTAMKLPLILQRMMV